VGRNLVPDTWTADQESMLQELTLCPHDKSFISCTATELAASRFCGVAGEMCINEDNSLTAVK